jgi:SH3-like domain-containing protein
VLGIPRSARCAIFALSGLGLAMLGAGAFFGQGGPAQARPVMTSALSPQDAAARDTIVKTHSDAPLGASGLPVPRWVSLKSGRVNVRQGPTLEHAIVWTYVREGLPVEIIAEFDTWRRVRDQSGEMGWVKQQMLAGKRTVAVSGTGNAAMKADAANNARVVAYAAPGLIASLIGCNGQWCEIEARGYAGFIARSRLWGVYRTE